MIDDMGMLYYRKSVLEEKGVAPPTTMDEVIAAAKALDSRSMKGLYLGQDGGIAALLTIAPWSAGSDFVDANTNQIMFNNERTVLAYQKVKEINDSGALLVGQPPTGGTPPRSSTARPRCNGPAFGRCPVSAPGSRTTSA